jgi:hypothetical protein
MITILFVVLLLVCLLAPWLGKDTSDRRSESAHPETGWYPPIVPH